MTKEVQAEMLRCFIELVTESNLPKELAIKSAIEDFLVEYTLTRNPGRWERVYKLLEIDKRISFDQFKKEMGLDSLDS